MPVSLKTKQILAEMICKLFRNETYIEVVRQLICEYFSDKFQSQYTPLLVFDHLSQGQSKIKVKDIQKFLNIHNVPFNAQDIELFMFNYSTSGQKLTYSDFLNIIIPSNCATLKINKSKQQDKSTPLSPDIQILLVKLFQVEHQLAQSLESLRSQLKERWDFSIDQLFTDFSGTGNSKSNYHSVKEFLNEMRVQATEMDILCFLRRADRDKDGVIGLSDFTFLVQHFNETKKNLKKSSKTKKISNHSNVRTITQYKIPTQNTNTFQKTHQQIIQQDYDLTCKNRNNSQRQKFLFNEQKQVEKPSAKSINNKSNSTQEILCELDNNDQAYEPTMMVVLKKDLKALVEIWSNFIRYKRLQNQQLDQISKLIDYDPEQLWNIFTNGAKGSLVVEYFHRYLNKALNTSFSFEEVGLIIQGIKNGLQSSDINQKDFIKFFQQPQKDVYLSENTFLNQFNQFSNSSIQLLLKLFRLLIECYNSYQTEKITFFQQKTYSLLFIFESIDIEQQSYLTMTDFSNLFKMYKPDLYITESELEIILGLFNKQNDLIQQISLRQFLHELTPNT